jgi:hypothetical protein
MLCSALNLVCRIIINSDQLNDTAKWNDILKLYETDRWNVLSHLLPKDIKLMQAALCPLLGGCVLHEVLKKGRM